ncbi:type II toxin-antitoxin system RelE/ParE family toxin [Candidatus Woesearchaeota archaeon]|nr:type II toxin-antitoxin system RelE/ParE family toxin [Candidatus Woesearchaeota archaeon]
MTYSVEWNPKVSRFLHKLERDITQRIILKVKEVQEDPFRYLEHYEGDSYYKLRVGNYRLLVDVDLKNKFLLVQVIGHRSNIYNRHP